LQRKQHSIFKQHVGKVGDIGAYKLKWLLLISITETLHFIPSIRFNGSVVYWRGNQDPADYKRFRVPVNEMNKRNTEDLPKEETASALVSILTNQISLPVDELVRETARFFGYTRLGGNAEQAMKIGIEHALKTNMISQSNERLVLS